MSSQKILKVYLNFTLQWKLRALPVNMQLCVQVSICSFNQLEDFLTRISIKSHGFSLKCWKGIRRRRSFQINLSTFMTIQVLFLWRKTFQLSSIASQRAFNGKLFSTLWSNFHIFVGRFYSFLNTYRRENLALTE